jgi:2-C-methyl-D-erythritol 4-phosphate cytidylyltransferase
LKNHQKRWAIIVAGGSGKRMGSELPKQFLLLNKKPILMHSIEAFYNFDASIEFIIVLPRTSFEIWEQLKSDFCFNIPHQTAEGGETRFHSVKQGLSLAGNDGLIAIHDAVRPLVSKPTLDCCFSEAAKTGNAVPYIPLVDSARIVEDTGSKIIDRDKLALIQTPQIFNANLLHKAYKQAYNPLYTDDASVVESIGVKINLVEGNRENIKITTPEDLYVAEAYLKKLISG